MVARNLVKPWWVRVLLVWAATRVVTTTLFLVLAQTQGPTYWTSARPSYFDFLNIWDAEWFEQIYRFGFGGVAGYQSTLPLDASGNVVQNAWAFMPGFPFLVRWLDFGPGWAVMAPTISLLLGFVLAILVYQIFLHRFDKTVSLWGVALLGLSAPSIVFQAGYADTLGLLLLALALLLILQHRYLWALVPISLLSITRPGVVALGLALIVLWLVKLWRQLDGQKGFATGEKLRLAVLAVTTSALGWLWSAIAWIVTERTDAYLATELSWRASFIGDARLVPFEGWSVSPAYFWGKPWGPYIMLGLVVAAVALLFTKAVRSLGLTLWLWVASYYAYLLLVFFPQSSTFRILLMVFPLFGALSSWMLQRRRAIRWMIVVTMVALQWWWLWECWRYVSPDFSPP